MKVIGVTGLVQWSTDLNSHLCYISFGDEIRNEMGDVTHDEFGVDDNSIFFYLSKDEVIDLLSAIVMEQKSWYCHGGDWTIHLSMGLSFNTQ